MSELLFAIAVLFLPSAALIFWCIVCFVFQKTINLSLVLFGVLLLTFGSIFVLGNTFGYIEATGHVGELYSPFKELALRVNYVLLSIINIVFCAGFLLVKVAGR